MKDTLTKICRKCGKPIMLIHQRIYRSIIVDADAVEIKADSLGDEYIRWDGTKVRARVVKPEEDVEGIEFAYRPHRWSCGADEV